MNNYECYLSSFNEKENYKLLFPDIKVILTGGSADILQPHIKNEIFALRDLVLHGLNSILLYNNR